MRNPEILTLTRCHQEREAQRSGGMAVGSVSLNPGFGKHPGPGGAHRAYSAVRIAQKKGESQSSRL